MTKNPTPNPQSRATCPFSNPEPQIFESDVLLGPSDVLFCSTLNRVQIDPRNCIKSLGTMDERR